jgi:hypothetical protein
LYPQAALSLAELQYRMRADCPCVSHVVFKSRSSGYSWEYHRIKTATKGAAVSHVSKNQAGIIMQDELQLERHQAAAHDHHHVCYE